MAGASSRAELFRRKEELESEIGGLVSALEDEDKGPGLHGNLIADDGFPRADIDIYAVRNMRHRLAQLQTDHQEVMKQIEALLFSGAAFQGGDAYGQNPSVAPSSGGAEPYGPPFARVEQVFPGSPAAEAGLKAGDCLVRVGSAQAGNHRRLRAVAEAVRASEGEPVRVVLLRDGAALVKRLVPRTWAGQGLLGCHIVPLDAEGAGERGKE